MSRLENNRQLKYIKTGADFTITCIKTVLDHLEEEYNTGISIIKRLQEKIDQIEDKEEGTMNSNMEDIYKEEFEKEMTEKNKIFEQTMRRHPRYMEMEQIIAGKTGQVAEEDMVVSEVMSYVDPWSKKPIETPVKNKVCSHLYDKATANKMCSRSKGKLKCPVIGCTNNNVQSSDLEEDHQVKQIIQSQLQLQ